MCQSGYLGPPSTHLFDPAIRSHPPIHLVQPLVGLANPAPYLFLGLRFLDRLERAVVWPNEPPAGQMEEA